MKNKIKCIINIMDEHTNGEIQSNTTYDDNGLKK